MEERTAVELAESLLAYCKRYPELRFWQVKPFWAGRNAAHFDDGTCWALPETSSNDQPSLEWVQRYGAAEHVWQQRLSVASVLACYEALIRLPQRERNARVKAIREAMAMRDRGERESGGG